MFHKYNQKGISMKDLIQKLRAALYGDIIEFGEIHWIVIKKETDSVLVISKYPVAYKAFNTRDVHRSVWEISSLRKWLNKEFYNIFTDEEKSLITETSVFDKNKDSQSFTNDRFFLLSKEEVELYMPLQSQRGKDEWWLRSTDTSEWRYYNSGSYTVDEYGRIYSPHRSAGSSCGVRPAVMLSFDREGE